MRVFYGGVLNTIRPSDSVLDLGCGIFQHVAGLGRFIVGVDCFAPYAAAAPEGTAFIHAAMPGCLDMFTDRSFDVVVCLDALEHMDEPNAMLVAARMRQIARREAIVVTPSAEMAQDAWDAWGLGHNPAQAHRSFVSGAALKSLGYDVAVHEVNASFSASVGVYRCP